MFRALIAWLLRLFGFAPRAAPIPAAPTSRPDLRSDTLGAPVPGGPHPFVIPQFIAPNGLYPATPDVGGPSQFTLGMIHATMPNADATNPVPVYNGIAAQGQILPVTGHEPLVSLLLDTYGGEFPGTFGIPDLRGKAIVGSDPNAGPPPGTLPLTWLIAATGQPVNPLFPEQPMAPLVGTIMPFTGPGAIAGWLVCDGSAIAASAYPELAALLGTTYGTGGAGQAVLPDFNGRVASGANDSGVNPLGSVFGESPLAGLCITYLICVQGQFPSQSGGDYPCDAPWLGQIVAYAGATPPAGWAVCDGSLLQMFENSQLFALMGTAYGGDGESNFALPDLRGAMIVGQS